MSNLWGEAADRVVKELQEMSGEEFLVELSKFTSSPLSGMVQDGLLPIMLGPVTPPTRGATVEELLFKKAMTTNPTTLCSYREILAKRLAVDIMETGL